MPVPTRDDFLIDPSIVFLNHGSFGATPVPVFEEYQRLQRAMERNPVEWLGRRADALMADARARLGGFVGADPDDVVFFPNPTTAVNMVARALRLQPGDEVLTTDHEYGAMDRTWRKLCHEADASYVRVPIPLPVTTASDFVERVWSAVTPRTRVLFLSHLTSATALVFPVHELCRRARAAGIISIVDGAHVPAHIPLDLASLPCDIYTGALHKWLCAPKGCSFLYARAEVQSWLDPLVVSWGWESDHPGASAFVDVHEWQGTRDLAPFLAVGAAIDFVESHDWASVRRTGHELALGTRRMIDELTGLAPISPDGADDDGHEWIGQLAAVRLPDTVDVVDLKARLFDEHRIEVPLHRWNDQPFVRVSFTAHNTASDGEALVSALRVLL
ncbi:MAG: aminotransferase class V-fold PLP-dependent enzyme [Actinobacteria bacterium]|nr:aminotransferase class V-fold PLP-dependent enzyme [Actinomycetota bacterium]